MTLEQAYRECARIQKRYGKSYYFATLFFEKKRRKAVNALYAFFRLPDEMVDGNSPEDAVMKLDRWENEWKSVLGGAKTSDPVLMAAKDVFSRYEIPEQLATDFLTAMKQDLVKTRYANYEELRQYMHGSAVVVGLMMTHVIGWQKEASTDEVTRCASALGEAMQLTNFLRDIGEDYRERGRIYLPKDELARFGLSDEDIAKGEVTPAFIEMMKWQMARIHALYEEANKGIALLNHGGRLPVRLASDLYRFILLKIEQNGYDVFTKRASTTLREKIKTIPLSMLYA
ncbi:MAG: phytoene/squalene synthase family protein [Patescibacteria group bacterium]